MVLVSVGGVDYHLDSILKSNLDIIRKYVTTQDGDAFIIITGSEGAGKSLIAMQISRYLDASFNEKSIAFTPQQFKDKVMSSPKFKCILYDEALNGFSWRSQLMKEQRDLLYMTFEMRQRNLFVVLCCPSFYDMNKTIAIHRSMCMIHCYTIFDETSKEVKRGFFSYYNRIKKILLWQNCRDTYAYWKTYRNFCGRFSNVYAVPKEKYLQAKREGLQELYAFRQEKEERGYMRGERQATVFQKESTKKETVIDVAPVVRKTVGSAENVFESIKYEQNSSPQ